MEDNLNFWANGRRPQNALGKWNTTSTFLGKMEDELNFLGKWKTTSTLRQHEDDLNYLGKWRTTPTLDSHNLT